MSDISRMNDACNEMITKAQGNFAIIDSVAKARNVLLQHNAPLMSISGGKDSDVMLDLMSRLDTGKKIKYVYFDTGLEYAATRRHIDFLEEKYDIEIDRVRSVKPIPLAVKEHGQPFLSKTVSRIITVLQNHNFDWKDYSYDELLEKYHRMGSGAKWWTNHYYWGENKTKKSNFNINSQKWLKEFMMDNPPQFTISDRCCEWSKKKTSREYEKTHDADVVMLGIRRAEGGARSIAYKSCFDAVADGHDRYRPLFFYDDKDEELYCRLFNVTHSDCYTVWGMKRTGCAGCPFNSKVSEELEVIRQYEPNIAKACETVFKDSYEYTKRFKEYKKEMNANAAEHR